MEILMHDHRVAPVLLIRRRSEQDAFPKIPDDRQMVLEIELGVVGEYVSDHFVAKRTLVEDLHQPIDVGSRFYVSQFLHASAGSAIIAGSYPFRRIIRFIANQTNAIAPIAKTVSPNKRIHRKVCMMLVCMNSGLRAYQYP